jgi:hypothetical protein
MAKRKISKYVFEPGISINDNEYPKAVALLSANKAFLQAQVVKYIDYNIANNIGVYAGYTYASQKCTRDVGFFIDAVIHDLRYGGNVKSRQIAQYFWIDGEPMIRGDVSPEITGQAYLRTIINDYIFTNTDVPTTYGSPTVPQVKYVGQDAESGADSRNTYLWNIFSTVISQGVDQIPAKITGVSAIKLLGNYTSSEILLITNTANGTILYNFADPATTITVEQKQGRSSGDGQLLDDLDYPSWWQTADAITTLTLSVDTSQFSATHDLQIFVEEPYQTIRPWEFGTDAIERMRVAAPQAMLDADFEYGLQPTKWQALGLIRGYPSIYEIPGTDLSVTAITTDASANTGNFGSSLITVTTSGTHGFSIQQPITVKGLNAAVPGFARAEGSFLVYSVPSSVTFTYYASARVGTIPDQSLYTSFVQVRQAGFYTGASIGQPTFSVFSNGFTQSVSSKFDTALGSFSIAFDGAAPTTGSPISGSPNIAAGTSVSGVTGASTVTANVKVSVNLTTQTSVEVVDTTGIQQQMAINNGSNSAVFINSLSGDVLNLSGAIGQTYVGANATNTAVTGTNINGIGSNATFDVSRSAGTYTVTDSGDSSSNGQNYEVGDLLKILGTDLGGASPTNDLLIQVTSVDSGGAIVTFSATGTSILGGATYNNVNSSSTTSIAGTAAQISVARTGGTGAYAISLASGGTDYLAGDTVTWSGTDFGGTSPDNDIVIRVDGVTGGAIVDYVVLGTPVGATGNATYPGEAGANVATTGTGASFNITRTDGVYTVAVVAGGSNYFAGNRIKILGTALDGATPLNDCVVTVGTVNTVGLVSGVISTATASGTPFDGDTITVYPTLSISEATTGIIADGTTLSVGAIATIQVDFATDHGLIPGTTILTSVSSQPAPAFSSTSRTLPASGTWTGIAFAGGTFIAVLSGTNVSARSVDGQTWSAGGNLPSSTTWTSAAAGVINSTTYFVAVASGGTAAAFSTNAGVSWTAATLPSSSTWSSVTYYNGVFVAVASGGTAAAFSTTGETWTAATLPSSSTWTDVAGGLVGTSSYFVAIASGGTAAAYSVDNGASWLATGALPASATWSSITYGNSRFFAVASGSTNAAFSTTGATWTAVTLPSSAAWDSTVFGDDSFLVISKGATSALTSFTGETGSFTAQTLTATSSWEDTAYGSYAGLGVFAVLGNSNAALTVNLTSANHQLATGPHVVTQVPGPTTIRYPSRTTGTINTSTQGLTGVVYARPDSFFTHRPFDGGVQLGTGNPSHGAQAIRQSKKYIRYQSGKGMMYTTGGLFAPSYNISSATALDTVINSLITFTCDDTDHGLQPGAEIEIIGMVSFEYNGDYVVESIVDARSFRVRSAVVLSNTTGTLGTDCKVLLKRWHGATVRIGAFDEQNGIFYQYDGREMAVVRRSSTNQLSGTVSISTESNAVVGSGTRFQDQLKVGDKIVIRGMSHIVSSITSQTTMTMTPDWRGANSIVGARVCITEELYIPQRNWNLDPIDGTGPSGYNLLPWRMQMLGMQYSWYAAGFIEFMMRGADGKFVFLHRIRNSNVNTEAYMRTANLPVRYEVENRSALSRIAVALTDSANTIVLNDTSRFPNSGIVYVDNEMISYSGKSGRTLLGLTRSASMTAFTAGQNRTFTAGAASAHSVGKGVTLISCTTSPTISHWGSALLTDGLFDTDRGYIFNYAATGLSVSTAKQTAFMIRLAPSVSNAIVGDLGERDLLNRAQLLLNAITLTADSGSGAIVVEGVLNPRNYPSSPSNITWTGLSSSAAGGQPSFAQIALGGSINWGGVPATTSTATVQGPLTTTISARGFSTVTRTITAIANPAGITTGGIAIANNRTDFYITNTQYDSLLSSTPLRVGDPLSLTTYITGGQTISNITRAFNGTIYTRIVMSANGTANSPANINQTVTVSSSIAISYASALAVGRTDFLITAADFSASNIAAGDVLSATTYIISAQTVSSITTGFATVAGISYTRIVMSSGANATIGGNTNVTTTVTASGTGSSYAGTNFLFFTSATWNSSGASVGTRVATSYTNFPAGTSVAAVASRRLGATTVVRVTFTQTTTTSVSAAGTVTFQFGDPQFALPGEQVFSFVANPGNTTSLELTDLKELTTTAIGGRGAFPNGPDVLAINVFKVTGTATPSSIILRWGEAQA